MLCDRMSVVVGLVDKAFHAIGGVNLTLAKLRMNEAIAQSIAFTRAVVVAAGAQARDQRMIDRLLVVAVVAGSVLFAMHFDGEAVDINRGPFDATASRSDHVFLDALGQSV